MAPLTTSQPADDAEPEPERAGRKRRRIALACEECRDRKRKCDGQRPVCGTCLRRPGQSCTWNDDRNTKGWSNNYVEGLRSRVRELEDALEASMSNRLLSPVATVPAHSTADEASQPLDERHWGPQNGHERFGSQNLPYGNAMRSTLNAHAPPTARPSRPTPPGLESLLEDHVVSPEDESSDALGSESCDTEVDAMGVIGCTFAGVISRIRRPSEYFGPSSTVSLLGEAYSAISPGGHERRSPGSGCWESSTRVDERTAPEDGQQNHTLGRGAALKDNMASFSLAVPPRAEADALIDTYWSWVHSLYPFVHRPSFQKRYHAVWSSREERRKQLQETSSQSDDYYDLVGDRLFHCMLNTVFAMGVLFNTRIPVQDRNTVSHSFFVRAKRLLDLDLLARGSPALVQTLLLMGQYLQSTDAASSCWNIVGLAIRVAQGIGLHHEPKCCRQDPCPEGHDQLESEMRRRTWAGAVILDRVLSLTYGRPLMVHPTMTRTQLALPSAMDDEFLTRSPGCSGRQPQGIISLTECYAETTKLQDILGQVLATFYHRGADDHDQGDGCFETERVASGKDTMKDTDIQMLLHVDGMLSEWHQKLPAHLKVQPHRTGGSPSFSSDPERAAQFARQANVLEARFLHTRLTLLRPVLSVLCRLARQSGVNSSNDSSLESTIREGMLIKAANLCVSVAEELFKLIIGDRDPRSSSERLQAPWYNVFYVHSSAIVLLLAYLCSPRYITCMDDASLISGCNECLSFLRVYQPYSPSARRCGKVLESTQRQVFRRRNGSIPEGNAALSGVGHFDVNLRRKTRPSLGTRSQDIRTPSFFADDTHFDLGTPGWMDEAPDMTWLSVDPFLQELQNGAI